MFERISPVALISRIVQTSFVSETGQRIPRWPTGLTTRAYAPGAPWTHRASAIPTGPCTPTIRMTEPLTSSRFAYARCATRVRDEATNICMKISIKRIVFNWICISIYLELWSLIYPWSRSRIFSLKKKLC